MINITTNTLLKQNTQQGNSNSTHLKGPKNMQ